MTDYTASKPGQLPPLLMLRLGESRLITIDLSPLLRQFELAVSAQCDDPRVSECRTRLGRTLEMRVQGGAGSVDLLATVRAVTGERTDTISVPLKLKVQ